MYLGIPLVISLILTNNLHQGKRPIIPRKGVKGKGRGQHNYHKLLEPIRMKSVAEIEAKGRTDFMLRIGNHVKKVRLHIIVAFFIGDGKSGDMLCGHFGGYTSVGCISRACDCPQAGCSNTEREL